MATIHVGHDHCLHVFFPSYIETTCTNVNMCFPINGSNYKLINFTIKVVVNYVDNVVNFINKCSFNSPQDFFL